MRVAPVFLAASLAFLGYAVAATPQGEPLAEQQFKNIVSFKGSKATDVIPAMEFMSASLKVDCEFCHTEDRASDDKPEKKTARAMIAMQRDINAKHFEGATEVTCATCHGGRSKPLSVPPVTGVETRAQRSTTVKPDDVISQFSNVVGEGPRAGIRLFGKSTQKGETASIDAVYLGDKFLIVRHTSKGDFKFGFNGSQLWYAAPGFSTVIPSEVAERFRNQNRLYLSRGSMLKLTRPTGGTARVARQDAVVLAGTMVGSTTRASLFVDKKSGRLLRASYAYPTVLGTLAENTEFTNYKKVGAAVVPMTITLHTGDFDETRAFSSAKEDARIDPRIFELPK
jgi:photosynthetic reaction center cytochrome c subunit